MPKRQLVLEIKNKFWEYIDITFANQSSLKSVKPEQLAEKLNLNLSQFSACLVSNDASNIVNDDISEGERLNIRSTPTFIVNGQVFIGTITESDIESFL